MKKRNIINLFIFIAIIAWGLYRYKNKVYTFKRTEFALDTVVEISLDSKSQEGNLLLDQAFNLVEKLDSVYNYYNENSILSKINISQDSIEITQSMEDLIDLSRKYYDLSNGKFNVAIGQLTDIWDINNEIVPDQELITKALTAIDFNAIKVDAGKLQKPAEIKINLGSLAKGAIIDSVISFVTANGAEKVIVNAGGDLRISGYAKKITIGIQHPRSTRNDVIQVLNISNEAVVTSGDYERSFIKDGIRYHHILDPHSGFPARNSMSVTVIADKAVKADALSTTLLLLKPEEAIALINNIDNVEAIIYFQTDNEIDSKQSKNMKDYFKE